MTDQDLIDRQGRYARQAGRSGRVGFSLLELLVIIAVIALLAAIVVPSLALARLYAKQVACQGNLHALGVAASVYQSDFRRHVPICWQNLGPGHDNPWKSWRTSLLPYAPGYAAFNCPGAQDLDGGSAVFHSSEEIASLDWDGTANAGSYGVMYQFSLPSYKAVHSDSDPFDSSDVKRGHPFRSCAFPSEGGVAWRDPANSVYAADAYLAKGLVTYPSRSYKGYGTSVILPPSESGYFGLSVTRRFADRHIGTNCLFVDGRVWSFETAELDGMTAGSADCVWDVD